MKITPRTKERKRKWNPHRFWMGFITLAMTVVTALSALTGYPLAVPAASAAGQEGTPLVVYVQDGKDFPLKSEDAARIRQVNYAFALIKDGKASGSHWNGIRAMSSFLKSHPQVDGVVSVGGWGAEGFSDACATEESRRIFAQSILNLMDEHGFRGVDIDWEYPGSSVAGIKSSKEDVNNFYLLLELLREGLDTRSVETGRKHLLSVALGASESMLAALDGKRLNSLVDQVVLMAYDLQGFDKTTGHHAGLYPEGKVKASGAYAVRLMTDAGISSGKILLGTPAYGRMWRKVTGGGNGLGKHASTSGNKVLGYDQLQSLEAEGYVRYWDDEAKAAWWFNGTNFASGEDARSIEAKAAFIREHQLLGAAVWSANHDEKGEMVSALYTALQ